MPKLFEIFEIIGDSIAAGWIAIAVVFLGLCLIFLVIAYFANMLFYRIARKSKKDEIPHSQFVKYIHEERVKSGTIKHNGVDSLRERL